MADLNNEYFHINFLEKYSTLTIIRSTILKKNVFLQKDKQSEGLLENFAFSFWKLSIWTLFQIFYYYFAFKAYHLEGQLCLTNWEFSSHWKPAVPRKRHFWNRFHSYVKWSESFVSKQQTKVFDLGITNAAGIIPAVKPCKCSLFSSLKSCKCSD